MGTHIPVCLLAGIVVAALAERLLPARSGEENAKPQKGENAKRGRKSVYGVGRAAIVALVVLLTAPTNVMFVLRDLGDTGERPEDLNWFSAYWPKADLKAMQWIREQTPRDAAFFCTPLSGRYIAAAAGRAVYAAHWGETPRFAQRVGPTIEFFNRPQSPDERLMQLRTSATSYVYQGTAERRAGQVDLSKDPGLEKVYDADGIAIYRVREGERLAAEVPR